MITYQFPSGCKQFLIDIQIAQIVSLIVRQSCAKVDIGVDQDNKELAWLILPGDDFFVSADNSESESVSTSTDSSEISCSPWLDNKSNQNTN